MGKKQHQKDRLFLTNKEWKEEWGGYKDKRHLPFHRLPYDCCAISFTNFEDPVCTEDGTVFDVTNIVPYISKHHSHPVTGAPLELSDLIPLTFHRNVDNEYECPILKKVFTQVCTLRVLCIGSSGTLFACLSNRSCCQQATTDSDVLAR
jgi:peptidyl-prolyl cis-trans isomerase-like 2